MHIFHIFLLTAFLWFAPSPLAASTYPVEVQKINREQADYKSPENTYSAIFSAMLAEDFEWYYEALTAETSRKEEEVLNQDSDTLREKRLAIFKAIDKVLILDKQPYENGIYLLLKVINKDGSTIQGPSIYSEENGLWKSTKKIPQDSALMDLIVYTPPPPI